MERSDALQIVDQYVENDSLKKHMLAVEAAMREYAQIYNGDPETWGIAGLLHDFDWEIHPTLEQHPHDGAPILRQHGVPEEIIHCILSHADHTGVPRESKMELSLHACDEITGLITAVALVRPSRSLHDLRAKSVMKKWKDRRFAANVDRGEIETAVQALGVDLKEHIDRVIHAMQGISEDLGFQPPPAHEAV